MPNGCNHLDLLQQAIPTQNTERTSILSCAHNLGSTNLNI